MFSPNSQTLKLSPSINFLLICKIYRILILSIVSILCLNGNRVPQIQNNKIRSHVTFGTSLSLPFNSPDAYQGCSIFFT